MIKFLKGLIAFVFTSPHAKNSYTIEWLQKIIFICATTVALLAAFRVYRGSKSILISSFTCFSFFSAIGLFIGLGQIPFWFIFPSLAPSSDGLGRIGIPFFYILAYSLLGIVVAILFGLVLLVLDGSKSNRRSTIQVPRSEPPPLPTSSTHSNIRMRKMYILFQIALVCSALFGIFYRRESPPYTNPKIAPASQSATRTKNLPPSLLIETFKKSRQWNHCKVIMAQYIKEGMHVDSVIALLGEPLTKRYYGKNMEFWNFSKGDAGSYSSCGIVVDLKGYVQYISIKIE